MATSNQVSTQANKSVSSSDAPTSKWPKSGGPGSSPNGFSRSARGRGHSRAGGRSANPKGRRSTREDPTKSTGPTSISTDNPVRPPLPAKPILSITAPCDPPTYATKPKNFSRRASRANSTLTTSQSSPVRETPISPASSRSPNGRKRSSAARGNNIPKIIPPAPQDDLLRPGRPRIGAVPHSAPVKDTPPHFAPRPPHTPTGGFDMSKDIDALVERVRAVAMAEKRPTTPGSHIDWAGDDDDSLPDLHDWGITSLSTPDPKTEVISPIIVDGLKPLPELNLSSLDGAPKTQGVSLGPAEFPESCSAQPIEDLKILTDAASTPHQTTLAKPFDQARTPEVGETVGPTAPPNEPQNPDVSNDEGCLDLEGLAQPIHALATQARLEPEENGLRASIHAPRAIVEFNSEPTHPGTLRNRQVHSRAQTVGRPFPHQNPHDNLDNCSTQPGRRGSHKHHTRNHSSPATTTPGRTVHSRPILTGDAISRLAKVVGSAATRATKPALVTND